MDHWLVDSSSTWSFFLTASDPTKETADFLAEEVFETKESAFLDVEGF